MTRLESFGWQGEETRGIGRVVSAHGDYYHLVCNEAEGEILARKKKSAFRNAALQPITGDFVRFNYNAQGESMITEVLPRFSHFERKDPTARRQSQTLAVNFDVLFVMMSVNENFSLPRLRRFLALAEDMGKAELVVVLTKCDLDVANERAAEIDEIRAQCEQVLEISAKTGQGIDMVRELVAPGKTVAFIGSSGVGKSTLLNTLAGEEWAAVQEIQEWSGKGRHTTTSRELVRLPNGAMVVDTPGIREIGSVDEIDDVLVKGESTHRWRRGSFTRRDTLKGVALLAAADKLTDGGFEAVTTPGKPERTAPILPPGVSRDFRAKCVACGLCIADCSEKIIRPSTSWRNFGQPELDFRNGHCILGCVRCSQVCPVGAFDPLKREQKPYVHIGYATWKRELCVRTTSGDECTACVRKCPVRAIAIVKGFLTVNREKCIGCGACEHVCPSRPMPAMVVNGYEEQRKVVAMSERDLEAEMMALVREGESLVVAREGQIVRKVEGRGLRPVYDLYTREREMLRGAVVCDKVVGRAAAAFYAKAGVSKVLALVMTDDAAKLLQNAGMRTHAAEQVKAIVNRERTGICPMEQAIENESDLDRIIATLSLLVK